MELQWRVSMDFVMQGHRMNELIFFSCCVLCVSIQGFAGSGFRDGNNEPRQGDSGEYLCQGWRSV
jgi:hypothetical protein